MKKLFAMLLIVVMVAALFAGCANNSSNGNTAAPATNVPAIDVPDAPAATVAPAATAAPAVTAAPAIVAPAANIDGTYYATAMNGQSLLDYYESIAQQNGMTLDAFLAASGLTENDLLSLVMMELSNGTATIYQMGQLVATVKYTFDGSTITFETGETSPYANNSFELYDNGDTYTMTKQ